LTDDLTKLTTDEYLDRLSGRTPTPGGGSAAALVAAVGCALARMVAEYSRSPQSASADWARIVEHLHRADLVCRALVTRDAEVYAALQDAARRRKERTSSQQEYDAAALAAVAVPLELTAVIAEVLENLEGVKGSVNKHLRCDLLAAVGMLWASAQAGKNLVMVNAGTLQDPQQRERVRHDVEVVLERCGRHARALEAEYAIT